MMRNLLKAFSVLSVLVLAACGTGPAVSTNPAEVRELALNIQAMSADVDPEEAQRAARIAYEYTVVLAKQYQITDPPLVHNTKVNMGIKPRGLCYQWADDIEKRLEQENFQTLDLHRAIANADNPFRLEHSTAIISAMGDDMYGGIVLDPWRLGGRLYWDQTVEDTKYNWLPRDVVMEQKRRNREKRQSMSLAGAS